MMAIDKYRDYDAKVKFCYKSDFDGIMKSNGCQYISQLIHKLYKETKSAENTGVLLGRTRGFVIYHLNALGVAKNPPGGSHPNNGFVSRFGEKEIKSIFELRAKGITLKKVAERFDCHRSTIGKILRDNYKIRVRG